MFIILLLALPLFSPVHVHAQEDINQQTIECKQENFPQNPGSDDAALRCAVNVQDPSGNPIQNANIVITGSGYDTNGNIGPITVSFDASTSPFDVCAYKSATTVPGYPQITEAIVSAPGYAPTDPIKINAADCGGLDDPIALTPLNSGASMYSCELNSTSDNIHASCLSKDAASCTDTTLCFPDAACSNKCGVYYRVEGADGVTHCVPPEDIKDIAKNPEEVFGQIPYATLARCQAALSSGEPVEIPTNPPTPPPAPLPCKRGIKYVTEAVPIGGGVAIPKEVETTDLKEIDKCLEFETGVGGIQLDIGKFVGSMMGILLSISGMIALYLIIRSGYQLMTSRGNPEAIQEARERLVSAVVGLLFIIFSLVIVTMLGVELLRIPGFGG